MLEIEEWFMIKYLYAQGFSKRAISKITGFDRRTVSKYVNNKSSPESKEQAKKGSKLDEYKDYITTKFHDEPYTASRLYREIQEMGFTGKYTIFNAFAKSFIKTLKYEEVYLYDYSNFDEAFDNFGNFIESVCDERQLHSKIGHLPLIEFEGALTLIVLLDYLSSGRGALQ